MASFGGRPAVHVERQAAGGALPKQSDDLAARRAADELTRRESRDVRFYPNTSRVSVNLYATRFLDGEKAGVAKAGLTPLSLPARTWPSQAAGPSSG